MANATAKDTLFFLLCMVAAADVRRFGWAVWVIIIGHVLMVLSLVLMFVTGDVPVTAATMPSIGLPMPPPQCLPLGLAGAGDPSDGRSCSCSTARRFAPATR